MNIHEYENTDCLQVSSKMSSEMDFKIPSTSATACCTALIWDDEKIMREGRREGEGRKSECTSLSTGQMEPCLFITSLSSLGFRG